MQIRQLRLHGHRICELGLYWNWWMSSWLQNTDIDYWVLCQFSPSKEKLCLHRKGYTTKINKIDVKQKRQTKYIIGRSALQYNFTCTFHTLSWVLIVNIGCLRFPLTSHIFMVLSAALDTKWFSLTGLKSRLHS